MIETERLVLRPFINTDLVPFASFVADPEVWKIVNGTLYLNLDRGIQAKWNEDIPGHIKTANQNWKEIRDKAPSAL